MAIELIKFEAEWCGPCKQQQPIIEELDDERDNLEVTYVNIEEDKDGLANKYGVRSVPTLVFLKDDEVQAQLTGLQSKADLESHLERMR